MNMQKNATLLLLAALLFMAFDLASLAAESTKGTPMDSKLKAELVKKLTPQQFRVTQTKGTEPAFLNEFWNNHQAGAYKCVVCGEQLFSSDNKFDSGCGWPSFDQPVAGEKIATNSDKAFGMTRTEVVCKKCGAHLGHVFDDGPITTTGQRYCINSASLNFAKTNGSAPATQQNTHGSAPAGHIVPGGKGK